MTEAPSVSCCVATLSESATALLRPFDAEKAAFTRTRPLMFVGEAILPKAGSFDPETISRGEPALPASFTWRGEEIAVSETVRTWRSTREDRGEQYLDRVWFEFVAPDGRHAVVYFDKHAKRPAERWRLYTLD